MDQPNDVSYYRRREASARFMAAGTSDGAIKRIHLDFAEHYAEKVKELDSRPVLRIII